MALRFKIESSSDPAWSQGKCRWIVSISGKYIVLTIEVSIDGYEESCVSLKIVVTRSQSVVLFICFLLCSLL